MSTPTHREALLDEAAEIAMGHPSKDARAFACSVTEYLLSRSEPQAGEAVAPFTTLIDGYFAQCKIEEAIGEILGVDILGVSYDYYDWSLEIFPDEGIDDIVVSKEQAEAILALGCNRFWINFPDSTERYGCGPRTAKYYCRWKQFNTGEAQQRRAERTTHPPAGEAKLREDGARRWLAVVQQKADHVRENANEIRKYPSQEQEARARELAAVYLLETAHFMAMDEAHAEMLEGLEASALRSEKRLAALPAEQKGGRSRDR